MSERTTDLAAENEMLRRQALESKRADEELRWGEQRYRSLVEAITAIVWNTPASGEFETEQAAWSAFTGQDFDQLKGWGWLNAVHPDDRPHTAAVWTKAVASRSLYHVEHRLRRHDGVYRHMLVRAVPILDDAGAIREWIGIHSDVSDQKHAEAALREAKATAEAANRTKSEFLANMSHEIRTPMNGIIGMTELVLNTALTKQQHEYLNAVKSSADSLLRLLNDILDFSKIEAGKLELETIDFQLRDSLADAMQLLATRAGQKGLELAYVISPDVPDALMGDRGRLRQIIVNMVGNAIKFTENGEVVVAVTVESQTDEDLELHFKVSDTGIGIPADKLHKIFEPFSQADSSTTRRYGGTGLGLTISMQLVALMGGRTWAESEIGKGSTFHFLARFALQKGVPRQAALHPEALKDLPVLVVDDNRTNRRILEDVLTGWGMAPVMADGWRSALAEIKRATGAGRPFRLALLDLMMPDVDGLGLAEKIRQEPAMTGCALLMLSSAGRPMDAERLRALGIAGCLTKPIKQSELLDAVLQSLSTEVAPEKASSTPAPAQPRSVTPRRILLAEDGLVNQKVAVGLLELRGHQVVVANNGKEALAVLEKQAFDVVLMDVQMPEMDGFQATASIRRKEKKTGGHVPIIAMTAHAMKGDREHCLEAGMDGYIAKPFQPEALYAAVEARGEQAGTAAPAKAEPPPVEVIDWEACLKRLRGRTEVLKEMAGLFCTEAATLLPQIREAVARNDAARLARPAHTLKGAAACFSAHATVEAASKLEQMARTGTLTGAADACAALEKEIDRLVPVLAAYARATS